MEIQRITIPDESYFGEVFVYLNWNMIIAKRYAISNYGRIYDFENKRFLNYSTDKDGYFIAWVHIPGVGGKTIRVHRFEMLSFYPIENYMEMQVNHKDGAKQNLMLGNLEWMTPIQNTRHGWENGLNPNRGTANGNGKLTDSEITKICELLDEKYTPSEITDYFGITEKQERMRFQSMISSIKAGKSHKDISKDFNFMKNDSLEIKYSEEFAHLVCKFLSNGNEYTYMELANLLRIPENELKVFKIFVTDILRGRTYKNVAKMYEKLKFPKQY